MSPQTQCYMELATSATLTSTVIVENGFIVGLSDRRPGVLRTNLPAKHDPGNWLTVG